MSRSRHITHSGQQSTTTEMTHATVCLHNPTHNIKGKENNSVQPPTPRSILVVDRVALKWSQTILSRDKKILNSTNQTTMDNKSTNTVKNSHVRTAFIKRN
jgi:hypothetical protein